MPHFASEWAHLTASQPACRIFLARRKIPHALVPELSNRFVLHIMHPPSMQYIVVRGITN